MLSFPAFVMSAFSPMFPLSSWSSPLLHLHAMSYCTLCSFICSPGLLSYSTNVKSPITHIFINLVSSVKTQSDTGKACIMDRGPSAVGLPPHKSLTCDSPCSRRSSMQEGPLFSLPHFSLVGGSSAK